MRSKVFQKLILILIVTGLIIIQSIGINSFCSDNNLTQNSKELSIGNTSGNIMNSGMTCLSDGWIYYALPEYELFDVCDLNKIYRINENGTKLEKVNNDASTMINVQGDWVYYRNLSTKEYGSIYRIRKNGSGRQKITTGFPKVDNMPLGSMDFWIIGKKIYYLNFTADIYGKGSLVYEDNIVASRICSVDIDGKNKKLLSNDLLYKATIYGTWIYYTSVDAKDNKLKLFKMKLDGTNKTIVVTGRISKIAVDGNNIFYIRKDDYSVDYGQLWKMNITENKQSKICDKVDCVNYDKDWLYVGLDNKGLYKINKSNNSMARISNIVGTITDVCVSNDWIHLIVYYDNRNDKTADYLRLKTDGTKLTEIDNIFDNKAYSDPKLYFKLYEKFNCKYVKGSFYYPKTWLLRHDYPYYSGVDQIVNDERYFAKFDGTVNGNFGFYNDQKTNDKYKINQIKSFMKTHKMSRLTTNKGKTAYYFYDNKKSEFTACIMDGHFVFRIEVDFWVNSCDKNVFLDMIKKVEI